jgi:hypothetical protein
MDGVQMLQFLKCAFNGKKSAPTPALSSFAFMAVHQLDKARIILTNASDLNSSDDMKRSIQHALQELDNLFTEAKKVSAEVRGVTDADVD